MPLRAGTSRALIVHHRARTRDGDSRGFAEAVVDRPPAALHRREKRPPARGTARAEYGHSESNQPFCFLRRCSMRFLLRPFVSSLIVIGGAAIVSGQASPPTAKRGTSKPAPAKPAAP